jgi:hypothetical protein
VEPTDGDGGLLVFDHIRSRTALPELEGDTILRLDGSE